MLAHFRSMTHRLSPWLRRLVIFLALACLLAVAAPALAADPTPPLVIEPEPERPILAGADDLAAAWRPGEEPAQPDVLSPARAEYLMNYECVAFASLRDRRSFDIYVQIPGGPTKQVSTGLDHELEPVLNRGCTMVTFTRDFGDYSEIFQIPAAGGSTRQLTYAGSNDNPAYSTDGSKIAFRSNRDGNYEIYVMNADGGYQKRLTFNAGDASTSYDGAPTWSPDGSKIAFLSRRSGGYRVWVMDADGANPRQVSYVASSTYPAWSPDGKYIAFSADGNGDGWLEVWIVDADGANPRLLASPQGQQDLIVRSFTPDAAGIAATRVAWVYESSQWWWTAARLTRVLVGNGNWANLMNDYDSLDWDPYMSTFDVTPPTIAVLQSLPALSGTTISPYFSAQDDWSGVLGFELQVRLDDGAWQTWKGTNGGWYVNESYTGALDGHVYAFRARPLDRHFNYGPWTPDDALVTRVDGAPPVSYWLPGPALLPAARVKLDIGGMDKDAGIRGFEITVINDDTQQQFMSYVYSGGRVFQPDPLPAGHYSFWLRGIDNVDNKEETGALYQALLYDWNLSGGIFDHLGASISGVTPQFPSLPLLSQASGISGAYAAYGVKDNDSPQTQVNFSKPGYGNQPAASLELGLLPVAYNAYLPPLDNLVVDGGFESGTFSAAAWQVAGDRNFFTRFGQSPHSGQSNLLFGPNAEFTRTLSLPEELSAVISSPLLLLDASGQAHHIYLDGSVFHQMRNLDGSWTEAQLIMPFPDDDFIERVFGLVSPDGGLHVFAVASSLLHIYWNPDGTWTAPEKFIRGDSYAALVSLDGGVHLFQLSNWQLLHQWRSPAGVWNPDQVISAPEWDLPKYAFTANPKSGVSLLYLLERANDFQLNFIQTNSDAWSAPNQIALFSKNVSINSLHLAALSTANSVTADTVAFWVSYDGMNETLWASERRQGKWQAPKQLATSAGSFSELRSFQDAQGILHVAWIETVGWKSLLFYSQRLPGGQWADPQPALPDVTRLFGFSADANGDLHIGAADYYYNFTYLRRSRDGEWAAPTLLPTQVYSNDAVAVSRAGNVYLATAKGVYGLEREFPAGQSAVQQAVTIPATMTHPILSWLYRVDLLPEQTANRFEVRVGATHSDTLQETVVFSTTQNGLAWQHAWADLSAWAGQTVTVTFAQQQMEEGASFQVWVDEVSLGSGRANLWVHSSASPLLLPPGEPYTLTLSLGNAGGAPAAGVTLTATLPAGVNLLAASLPPQVSGRSLTWALGDLPAQPPPREITLLLQSNAQKTPKELPVGIASQAVELETANNYLRLPLMVHYRHFLPLITRLLP